MGVVTGVTQSGARSSTVTNYGIINQYCKSLGNRNPQWSLEFAHNELDAGTTRGSKFTPTVAGNTAGLYISDFDILSVLYCITIYYNNVCCSTDKNVRADLQTTLVAESMRHSCERGMEVLENFILFLRISCRIFLERSFDYGTPEK